MTVASALSWGQAFRRMSKAIHMRQGPRKLTLVVGGIGQGRIDHSAMMNKSSLSVHGVFM